MTYDCPVCGYAALPRPPKQFGICPCCGTEFELDDDEKSHLQLRIEWLDAGAPWFSTRMSVPPNWNPLQQLAKAGLLQAGLLRADLRGPGVGIDFHAHNVQTSINFHHEMYAEAS